MPQKPTPALTDKQASALRSLYITPGTPVDGRVARALRARSLVLASGKLSKQGSTLAQSLVDSVAA